MIRKKHKIGDHLVVCDISGFTCYASETVLQWDGKRVRKDFHEPRNPLDLLRVKKETIGVPDARPPGVSEFQGPLTTRLSAAADAGDQTVSVESSVRFDAGDKLRIGLDNRTMFFALVQSVPDEVSVTLTQRMPFAASSGNEVVNVTAMSPSDLE